MLSAFRCNAITQFPKRTKFMHLHDSRQYSESNDKKNIPKTKSSTKMENANDDHRTSLVSSISPTGEPIPRWIKNISRMVSVRPELCVFGSKDNMRMQFQYMNYCSSCVPMPNNRNEIYRRQNIRIATLIWLFQANPLEALRLCASSISCKFDYHRRIWSVWSK